MEADEQQELQLLALEDFKQALSSSLTDASATLASYLAELHGAPEELLQQLAACFRQGATAALAAAVDGEALAADWQQLHDLQALVLKVVTSSRRAVFEAEGVLQDAAAALLFGQEGESPVAAVRRLQGCPPGLLAAMLGGGCLRHLPPPASHQQRRSMLACLLWLQLLPAADSLSADVVGQLASLAAPAWYGRDLVHAQQQMAAAFEAFVAIMQGPAVQQLLGGAAAALVPRAAAEIHAAALRFLQLFRAPVPAVSDLWWAHFTAVLYRLVDLAQREGTSALQRPALKPLVHSLCTHDVSGMVVQLVMAHPSYQPAAAAAVPAAAAGGGGRTAGGKGGGGKKGGGKDGGAAGARSALSMASELLAHDIPAFLSGCCELLRPEASTQLQARVDVLAAMERATESYQEAQAAEAGNGEAHGSTGHGTCPWTPADLDQLLYALRSDPSVRLRRQAVRLLSCMAVAAGTPQEAAVLHAVCQRCRDKDEAVRQEAFAVLSRFPLSSLEAHLQLSDWQLLLDTGLAGPLPQSSNTGSGGAGSKPSASKHAAAIARHAKQLLQLYLHRDSAAAPTATGSAGSGSEDEGGWDEAMLEESEDRDEAGQRVAGADCRSLRNISSEWLCRAQALQLPPHADSAAVRHLEAAWKLALLEVLSPEELGALGMDDDPPADTADAEAAAAGGDGSQQDVGMSDW